MDAAALFATGSGASAQISFAQVQAMAWHIKPRYAREGY